jgi:signal transduction histidine kinase
MSRTGKTPAPSTPPPATEARFAATTIRPRGSGACAASRAPAPSAALERAMGMAEAFLIAEAGRRFAASLELDVTLRNIGDLVVGWMADWCVLDVLEPDGQLTRTSVATADPVGTALESALLGLSLDSGQPTLLGEALNSRSPVLVTAVTDEHLVSCAQSSMHLELLRAMHLTSYIAVPLTVSGELLGGMIVGSTRGSLGPGEMATAEEVGRIAALAIKNARSYEASRNALTARDDRLAIVTHDLRAPLSNAVFAAGLLRLRLREAGIGGLDRVIDVIDRSAEHMASLIGDLADVVSLQRGHLSIARRPLPATSLVREATEAFGARAAEAGIELIAEVAENCGNVAADRTRILQVISNLVGNALKFTERGGCVRVTARPEGAEVHFSVADDGAGIPPEALGCIFEPFSRGTHHRDGGLGLGLAIAHEIVQLHGGRIWMESEPGKGTEVHFSLEAA